MLKLRLEQRIVVLFVGLTIALLTGAFLILNLVGSTNARRQVTDETVLDERVFLRLLDQDAARLSHDAHLIVSQVEFKAALLSRDSNVIARTLGSYADAVAAEVMLFVDRDLNVVADTLAVTSAGHAFPLVPLIRLAEEKGEASGMARLGGSLFQIVVVPVRTPATVGWAILGFAIDQEDANALQELAGLQVSYATRAKDSAWRVEASTLKPEARLALAAEMNTGLAISPHTPVMLRSDGGLFETIFSRQPIFGDEEILAVLQRPLSRSMGPLRALEEQLIAYAVLGLVISILAIIAIARGIANPVQRLAAFSQRLAAGDYSEPVNIRRSDEIGDLADAFDHMRTEINQRERRILQLAYQDALTGLPNRAMFYDRLSLAVKAAKRAGHPLTVMAIDLDRFKEVNDTLGHAGGDKLLCEVGKRLRSGCQRATDTVARMGGDEFAILLPAEGSDAAVLVVQKLLRAFEAPFTLEGHLVDIRGSFGIASFPQHGTDEVEIMRHADSAMYVAKRGNSGFAVCDPAADHASISRLSLMTELRQAVESDELVLYYQPKLSLEHPGRLCAEALIRWKHSTRGFVPPDEFIPFAETTGYITVITGWVIRHAMRQMRQWRDDGIDVFVAINISTRDLTSPSFTDLVADLLDEYACPGDRLTFEITETGILGDPTHSLASLHRLEALGCRLAIDDFGTGYSSLAYLRQLPVHELKIDKSFVLGMTEKAGDSVIVKATIDLGHNMGLKVVAEGVETAGVRAALEAMGCDSLQGYLISKPLPALAFAAWVERVMPAALEELAAA